MSDSRPGLAAWIGIAVFLAGAAMVAATFWRALGFFGAPPQVRLGIKDGQPIDLAVVAESFGHVAFQTLGLVIMAVVGAILANQGVKLYAAAIAAAPPARPSEPGPDPKPSGPEPRP
jgi:hypothetical protein